MRLFRVLPLLLFGLAFAGGGAYLLSQTAGAMWQDWHAMRSWQPAYGKLLSVSGADNQTRARYRYDVDGLRFENDRVYVAEFNDNIGSYHDELRSRLERHESTGAPVTVWVNPNDPSQAVIDRDMRWGLFSLISAFCAAFILAGLLVVYAALNGGNSRTISQRPPLSALRREWEEKQKDPNFSDTLLEYARQRHAELEEGEKDARDRQNWRTRKGWETSIILSEAKRGTFVLWFFALAWNAISAPVLFFLPEELDNGNLLALVGVIFPLAGVYLLFLAIRSTLEYRRFGTVAFEMDPHPGAIGGHVGGHILVPHLSYDIATNPAAKLTVRLECVYSYMSGSGDDRSRREDIKWAEEGSPLVEHAAQGVQLAFRFNVPDNLPEADPTQTGAYHFWRVDVKAGIPGTDLKRQYNIPVFRTGESSRSVRHDISAQVAKRKEQESEVVRQQIARGNFDIPALSRAMNYREAGGEIRMSFPMFRNKLLTAFAAIFAGGFGFAAHSMSGIAFKGGISGLLVAVFSIPFVLVAMLASIATVYLLFNNLRVRIARNEVTVLRRLLFIPVFSRRLNVTDIAWLAIRKTGSTGQGIGKIEHFKLIAQDHAGKSVTLAEDLDGEDAAGHFRDHLSRRLNVEARTAPLPAMRLRAARSRVQ